MTPRELADVQTFPGWGELCVDCKHTYPDKEKYVGFAPSFPCKKVRIRLGGEFPALDNMLKRYVDGSEECPEFQKRRTR